MAPVAAAESRGRERRPPDLRRKIPQEEKERERERETYPRVRIVDGKAKGCKRERQEERVGRQAGRQTSRLRSIKWNI